MSSFPFRPGSADVEVEQFAAFEHGEDIHAATAAKLFNKTLDEVTSEERRRAKTANFGIIYGISAFGLSQRLEIPRKEAKDIIDGYFESYPKVKEYMDNVVARAKEEGCLLYTSPSPRD